METVKHLTENQLHSYAAGSLEKGERSEIGRHLLCCAACRDLLPLPTPQRLFAILMGGDDLREENKSPFLTLFSSAKTAFRKPPVLAWSIGSLVIILGFSVFMWFAIVSGSNNKDEVARGFDTGIVEIKQSKIDRQIQPPPTENNSNDEKPISSNNSNLSVANKKPIVLKTDSQKGKLKLTEKNLPPERNNLVADKESISLTRGGSAKCGEEISVVMEFASKDGAITFRWKKVENAIKYHLYISDVQEILIDEYETQDGTSYILKKTLDPEKTYNWKILVTLENGETVIGTSQKFTAKEIKVKNFDKKEKSSTRCSEKN